MYEDVAPDYTIKGYDLFMTCSACPEQYDVLKDGEQVGYLRLRHGRFTATYPDVRGNLVYDAHPMGDGIFEDQERLYHLTAAVMMIALEDGVPVQITVPIDDKGVTLELSVAEAILLRDQLNKHIEQVMTHA